MKKVIWLGITIIIIMLTGISTKANATWTVGDVNRNGCIDGEDVCEIQEYIAKKAKGENPSISVIFADINNDDIVDEQDLELLLKKVKEKETNSIIQYDIIELKEKCLLYNSRNLSDLNRDKETLNKSDVCIVKNVYADNWVGVIIDSKKEEFFINVSDEKLIKIGRVVLSDETTTTETTTTTTTTTETTTTTTTTTETTTTTTTTETTTTTITTETTTTTDQPYFSDWQCIRFNGEYWNIRSSLSTTFDENIIDKVLTNENCFIKKYLGNNWYEIVQTNLSETGYYILIEPDNKYLFSPLNTLFTSYFKGEEWNIRISMSLLDDSNIVGQLYYGDVVGVLEYYPDGWAKIITNKGEGYVVLQPFERLS